MARWIVAARLPGRPLQGASDLLRADDAIAAQLFNATPHSHVVMLDIVDVVSIDTATDAWPMERCQGGKRALLHAPPHLRASPPQISKVAVAAAKPRHPWFGFLDFGSNSCRHGPPWY